MSLSVHAYVRNAQGKMSFIEPDDPSEELAGFEVYRRTLYGSRAAILLGLRLLPRLAEGDIYAVGDDLVILRADAEMALTNLRMFEAESGATAERLRPRFENILRAIDRAERAGGGVVIW
jgi:hypothetical protein